MKTITRALNFKHGSHFGIVDICEDYTVIKQWDMEDEAYYMVAVTSREGFLEFIKENKLKVDYLD